MLQFMTRLDNDHQGANWLGVMAVWLSGISMVIYFCFSDAVRHYFIFVGKSLSKALKVLSK